MEGLYQLKRSIFRKDFDLKIQNKEQTLEYLKSLILSSTLKPDNGSTNNILKKSTSSLNNNTNLLTKSTSSEIAQPDNRVSICKQCGTSVLQTQRCGFCHDFLCKNCTKACTNIQSQHNSNGYCQSCVTIQCILCQEAKHCKACVKHCFYVNCSNAFCSACYDKNKHQIRPDNTNCRFYKCDSCNTDTNCIMTTIYCAKCDKRICKDCYFKIHLAHNIR
jgi:hypothetical protein